MQASTEKRILVMDDDQEVLNLLAALLQDEGYRVVKAANGRAGLEAVQEQGMPDLIILDMRMPIMSGYDFAREFHARYGWQVPIIVLTASTDRQEQISEIGAAHRVDKPFDLDRLVSIVARYAGQTMPAQ